MRTSRQVLEPLVVRPDLRAKGSSTEPRRARLGMSSSAHVVRVKRLYRQGLKCLQNWAVHRDLFIIKGLEMRAEFEAQRHVSNPSIVEKLVSDGEAKLVTYEHPAPYTRAPAPAPRTQAPRPLREPPRAPLARLLSCLSSDHARRHQVPATPKQRPGMEPGGAQPLIAAPRHLPVLGPPARPEASRVAPRRPFPGPPSPVARPAVHTQTLDRPLVRPVVRHSELLQVSWPLRWRICAAAGARLRGAARARLHTIPLTPTCYAAISGRKGTVARLSELCAK